jgi:hypothetical protein
VREKDQLAREMDRLSAELSSQRLRMFMPLNQKMGQLNDQLAPYERERELARRAKLPRTRAILIDPEQRTLTKIPIADDHGEQCDLIMNDHHREKARLDYQSHDELFMEGLDSDEAGTQIISNNYRDEDEPSFLIPGREHFSWRREDEPIHGRALVVRWNPYDDKMIDLEISVDELAKRIKFVRGREEEEEEGEIEYGPPRLVE